MEILKLQRHDVVLDLTSLRDRHSHRFIIPERLTRGETLSETIKGLMNMDRRSITRICMHGQVRQEQRIFRRAYISTECIITSREARQRNKDGSRASLSLYLSKT